MSEFVNRASVSAQQALALVTAAAAAASDLERRMSIAVVDDGGNLAAFLRMDGAYLGSAQLAKDKAYCAVAMTRPTAAWPGILAGDAALGTGLPLAADRFVPFGGGVPVTVDGQVAGAVGVSGGHYTDDVAVAERAIASVVGSG